ncbi:MAG: hypothetical protein EU536_02210 [Promethearchaeota archaeon]|nr:MAG: hypothetical protein EU536_02210 [Candidatus Lokiarchaeota archaeon]
MSARDEMLNWSEQKNKNTWDAKRRYAQTLEELFDGNVRYLKILKNKDEQAVKDGFQATVDFTFEKNMGLLRKLSVALFTPIARKLVLKQIIASFFKEMQHVVRLDCIQKIEFNSNSVEIIIDKCTGKRAWKLGLKNNQATELFTEEDYCNYSCIPLLNKFLGLVNAENTVELQKRGCHHKIGIQ